MARYSGEVINHAENEARKSHYRIRISKNVYLDAERHHHFEGRFINDGKRAGKTVNVRFAAGYRLNTCSTTNLKWIRIYATRNIQAGEELFLDYGDDFWRDTGTIGPTTPATVFEHVSPTHTTPLPTGKILSPIRPTRLQRTPPPLSGILLLQPPSPWAPTTSPPRIHGHHNQHVNSHTHTHNTIHLNDSLILNDTHTYTPIWDDTLIMNDTHSPSHHRPE